MVALTSSNGASSQYLIHRLVASTFIGDVKGMHVHHKDHNKKNPDADNLEIMTVADHHIGHSRGDRNATAKMSNDDVRDICEMLKDGKTHVAISKVMTEKLGIPITVSSIEKISSGSNWAWLSKEYGLSPSRREAMNEFSKKRVLIGRLGAIDGLSVHQIADRLGIKYKTKQYARFSKCAYRYIKRFKDETYFKFSKFSDNNNT